MSKSAAKGKTKGKGPAADKSASGKRGKTAAKGGASSPLPSVATHPRARRQVRQAKGWAGLGGFVIALALSLHAEVPPSLAVERAIIAGIAGYLIGWGCALAVWRALLLAELRAHAETVKQRRAESAAGHAASDAKATVAR